MSTIAEITGQCLLHSSRDPSEILAHFENALRQNGASDLERSGTDLRFSGHMSRWIGGPLFGVDSGILSFETTARGNFVNYQLNCARSLTLTFGLVFATSAIVIWQLWAEPFRHLLVLGAVGILAGLVWATRASLRDGFSEWMGWTLVDAKADDRAGVGEHR